MSPDNKPLLSLRGWSLDRHSALGYHSGQGPRTVLENIDLDLHAGRWLAVVGANGSGKSSLLKYLASEDSPLADQAAIMFQDPDDQIFATGVDREITLGREGRDPEAVRQEFGLAGLGEMNPRLLSAGQKQRLVLAVALGDAPQVLLCDEPTSLQDPGQAEWVLDRLDQWRHETGGALVTATCDRAEAARTDEIMVLAEGRILVHGPTKELLDDPRVVELLGEADKSWNTPPVIGDSNCEPILTLTDIGCDFVSGSGFNEANLIVRPGDRWGLMGVNGCGKSTLLALCAGARRPERGVVVLGGQRLYRKSGLDLDHGQALLAPQFPEYLFTRSDVASEIKLDPVLADQPVGTWLEALGLAPEISDSNPHDLSSGQRRRLALGLILGSNRPLILLDEPTAALDAEGKARVLGLLDQLPVETALVIASHDREFLSRAGCRVCEVRPDGLSVQ